MTALLVRPNTPKRARRTKLAVADAPPASDLPLPALQHLAWERCRGRNTRARTSRPGIVHIGVGGFHRAHQATYLDRLMNAGKALDWGICGVGVHAGGRRDARRAGRQDGLYTLVVKHAGRHREPRVIGSIVEYLFAPDDPEAVIEKMAAPATRIVSLTVTEGGYNLDHVTGEFDADNPRVRPTSPGAAPSRDVRPGRRGFAAAARARGAPFTVMSCDNFEGNGDSSG